MWRQFYCVITYIYSLLIEKDICDRQNVSVTLPRVYVCLSFRDLFIFSARVSSFCVIHISVLSFPHDLWYKDNSYLIPFSLGIIIYSITDSVYMFRICFLLFRWTGTDKCKPLQSYVTEWLCLGVVYIGGCCRTQASDIEKVNAEVKKWIVEGEQHFWIYSYVRKY